MFIANVTVQGSTRQGRSAFGGTTIIAIVFVALFSGCKQGGERTRLGPGNQARVEHVSRCGSVEVMLRCGKEDLREGRHARALAVFSEAYEADITNQEAQFLVGVAYMRLGDEEQAQRFLAPLVIRRADLSAGFRIALLSEYANVCVRTGDIDRAIRFLEEAVVLDPNNLIIHSGLAKAHLMKGDLVKAEAYARKALSIRDSHGNRALLAKIVLQTQGVEAAREVLGPMFSAPASLQAELIPILLEVSTEESASPELCQFLREMSEGFTMVRTFKAAHDELVAPDQRGRD